MDILTDYDISLVNGADAGDALGAVGTGLGVMDFAFGGGALAAGAGLAGAAVIATGEVALVGGSLFGI